MIADCNIGICFAARRMKQIGLACQLDQDIGLLLEMGRRRCRRVDTTVGFVVVVAVGLPQRRLRTFADEPIAGRIGFKPVRDIGPIACGRGTGR